MLEVVGRRRNGGSSIDVSKIVGDAANVAVGDRLRPLEQRLAALERSRAIARGPTPPPAGASTPSHRESTRSSEAATTAPTARSARNAAPEPEPETGTDWRAVKKFYKQTRSPKQTAAHFDLSINTVKARVRREGW